MKISQALRDPAAIEGGVWVQPVPDHPEFKVRAVARGPGFHKRVQGLEAQWARIYGARGAPPEVNQRMMADVLFEECIVAVDGLEDATLEDAKRLCGTFEGQPLYIHFLTAVNMVEGRRASDAEQAEGNSEPSSTGT